MGLFDIFKKEKQKKEIKEPMNYMPNEKCENVQPNLWRYKTQDGEIKEGTIEYRTSENGEIQVDFHEKDIGVKQFYDTTRIIIGKLISDEQSGLYDCKVSWYNHDEPQILDKPDREIGNRVSYQDVLIGVDPRLVTTDTKYCFLLMKELLNWKRVNRYIENGLKENPSQPCGKYIGGIMDTEEGYKRCFDEKIGNISHNSSLMQSRRQEKQKRQEAYKQKEIERLQNQIQNINYSK